MTNNDLLEKLREEVICQSSNKNFIHHKWFAKYHLEIVEAISLELCSIYSRAEKFRVLTLVWLHDYEKIIGSNQEHNTELLATCDFMKKLGFDKNLINKVRTDINTINSKQNLKTATTEVQIVSSSDAASHFVGPFGALYWYENSTMSIKDIQAERYRKISTDWEKKVTIPEIKKAFKSRYIFTKEASGDLPKNYLS